MTTKFYGINEIHTTQFTYCALIDDNMMYVGVDAQSNTKKKSEDLMLIFTREQIVEMYESMLSMEISNFKFLKKQTHYENQFSKKHQNKISRIP